MLVAFSVTPLAVGEAVRVVRDSGLPNQTDAMFTTVEGDWVGVQLTNFWRTCHRSTATASEQQKAVQRGGHGWMVMLPSLMLNCQSLRHFR